MFGPLKVFIVVLVVGIVCTSDALRLFSSRTPTVTVRMLLSQVGTNHRTKHLLSMAGPGSYQDRLQRARVEAGMPQAPMAPKPAAPAYVPPLEAPMPSMAKGNPSGLPFSDEMYSKLKFVIEKLSGRMKSEAALSWEELEQFKSDVDHIILDANIPNVAFVRRKNDAALGFPAPPAAPTHQAQVRPPSPQANPQVRYSKPVSPRAIVLDEDEDTDFEDEISDENLSAVQVRGGESGVPEQIPEWMGDLAGTQSSWNVPGMKNMNTEEYYKAVNQRLTNMKALRKQLGEVSPDPGGDYIAQLNKRNRSE